MRISTAVSALLLLAGACGCSDSQVPTWPVSGKVVLEDGTPLETGTVEFASDDGIHTARGTVQSDGSFRLTTFRDGDGAVAGAHDVVVIQLISTEDLPMHQHDHGPTIDPRFAHYDRSGLRFTVKPEDDNEFRIVVAEVDPDHTNP
ncbi:MAG: carboxypeptidase regulatory-like domain-containing protein [Planctomycetota bacterium]|jgi:hypothetical protein